MFWTHRVGHDFLFSDEMPLFPEPQRRPLRGNGWPAPTPLGRDLGGGAWSSSPSPWLSWFWARFSARAEYKKHLRPEVPSRPDPSRPQSDSFCLVGGGGPGAGRTPRRSNVQPE